MANKAGTGPTHSGCESGTWGFITKRVTQRTLRAKTCACSWGSVLVPAFTLSAPAIAASAGGTHLVIVALRCSRIRVRQSALQRYALAHKFLEILWGLGQRLTLTLHQWNVNDTCVAAQTMRTPRTRGFRFSRLTQSALQLFWWICTGTRGVSNCGRQLCTHTPAREP